MSARNEAHWTRCPRGHEVHLDMRRRRDTPLYFRCPQCTAKAGKDVRYHYTSSLLDLKKRDAERAAQKPPKAAPRKRAADKGAKAPATSPPAARPAARVSVRPTSVRRPDPAARRPVAAAGSAKPAADGRGVPRAPTRSDPAPPATKRVRVLDLLLRRA